MYLWLVCFVVLFGLSQLYPWVQEIVLPFPVTLLAGVGLAIASNLKHRRRLAPPTPIPPQVSTSAAAALTEPVPPTPPPQQPPLSAPVPSDTISFTIRKPGSTPSP